MSEVEQRLAALEHRVGELEDVNAIRRLHWAYGYYIDFNRPEEVADLFAEDGVVVFLSGEYVGKAGVMRLYGDWIQQRFTGGRPGPVDGLLLDHFQMQDIITVAPDRQTAKGRFRGMLFGGWHDDFLLERAPARPPSASRCAAQESHSSHQRPARPDATDAGDRSRRGTPRPPATRVAPPAGRTAGPIPHGPRP